MSAWLNAYESKYRKTGLEKAISIMRIQAPDTLESNAAIKMKMAPIAIIENTTSEM